MNSYVLLIALVVATGGFVFGVDSGMLLPPQPNFFTYAVQAS